MPRAERVDVKNCYYHVLNRANARLTLFEKPKEYRLFESVLEEATKKWGQPPFFDIIPMYATYTKSGCGWRC